MCIPKTVVKMELYEGEGIICSDCENSCTDVVYLYIKNNSVTDTLCDTCHQRNSAPEEPNGLEASDV